MIIHCYKCNKDLDKGAFSLSQINHHLSTDNAVMCSSCNTARCAAYRSKKDNTDKIRKKSKEYYYRNRDRILKQKKEYSKEYISDQRVNYYANNLEKRMVWSARGRAKKKGIEFKLSPSDIVIPEMCPLLNIPLRKGVGRIEEGSPSLDRIDPTKGYVPENVQVISSKANTMKSNATLKELELLVKNMKKLQN